MGPLPRCVDIREEKRKKKKKKKKDLSLELSNLKLRKIPSSCKPLKLVAIH